MKAGEHKGVTIYLDTNNKNFFTTGFSHVGHLKSEVYKILTLQIDAKMEEEGLKYIPNHSPTRNEIDSYIPEGYKVFSNANFTNCTFITPKGYDKLSAEQKTLIDNLIKEFNEKK